ncbi:hypothetical protein BUALT_Bualt14G0030800 [Buddleja alternifolia]|uniref:Retrotransposon gag domain-containing protein n=1 Tax=Buddleja alternifolia TaxID=168488 RepID=A0AAV6WHD7_9LAMI|nr:hypothetical protein BUALT_Bualt14G0030800 [Buddleja alternifolia]
MVDIRFGKVRRAMDLMMEQMRLNKESTDKDMAELCNMIATLAAAQNGENRVPGFNYEDLCGWIFKCEQLFEVDETPFNAKVRLVAVTLKDPMAELMNLKQVGSVKDYLDRFNELLNNVELSEAYSISCFLAGLKSEIAIQYWKSQRYQNPGNNPMRNNNRPNGKRLSDGKYTVGHVCGKKRQLFLVEVGDDEEETMKVTEHAEGKNIHILIDTESTHNFLDITVSKRLGCKIEETELLPVFVIDGNKIYSSSTCRNFSWKIRFEVDLMLLPLGGCDMSLGVQWLIQLGDIN